MLFCSENTTIEEIELLFLRFIKAKINNNSNNIDKVFVVDGNYI